MKYQNIIYYYYIILNLFIFFTSLIHFIDLLMLQF